jgi:sugar O-acyltransferase (sialic acid O-acetyltransferase NeuD family)
MTTAIGWIVYGCRTSYTGEVAEIIWRLGSAIRYLVDNLEISDEYSSDMAEVVQPTMIGPEDRDLPTVIPQVTPGHRYAMQNEARETGLHRFTPLIDPNAVVPRRISVGEGAVVNAGTVIGANSSIGRFVHINRSASIGHDADVRDFVSIGPGAVLAGHVRVMAGAFVGAGAVCAPEVAIGENAVVGAGAVVVKDVPPGALAVGNPARVVRQGDTGYGGVAVPGA